MSDRSAIWNDLPAGLDEAVLLAWVEDELPEAERARVEAALRARPALLGRLDAIRGDRLTLQSLGEERAPAHLLDSIEQTLERGAESRAPARGLP
jgi:anti-sigma factor RsiW